MSERVSTQGCTELTCLFHGPANDLKRRGFLRAGWEPDDKGSAEELATAEIEAEEAAQ